MLELAKIPRQIGRVVKDKRLEMGLTQSQLAESSNTSRSLVYRLEKGITKDMSLDKLYSVLGALGLGLAVFDEKSKPKRIQAVRGRGEASHSEEGSEDTSSETESSPRKAPKRNSSRNSEAQYERELKAAQNIKGFNVIRPRKD